MSRDYFQEGRDRIDNYRGKGLAVLLGIYALAGVIALAWWFW